MRPKLRLAWIAVAGSAMVLFVGSTACPADEAMFDFHVDRFELEAASTVRLRPALRRPVCDRRADRVRAQVRRRCQHVANGIQPGRRCDVRASLPSTPHLPGDVLGHLPLGSRSRGGHGTRPRAGAAALCECNADREFANLSEGSRRTEDVGPGIDHLDRRSSAASP